ncbi:MAG: T9SS type A sorting domain-containing protein [Bacteroidia bacterium]
MRIALASIWVGALWAQTVVQGVYILYESPAIGYVLSSTIGDGRMYSSLGPPVQPFGNDIKYDPISKSVLYVEGTPFGRFDTLGGVYFIHPSIGPVLPETLKNVAARRIALSPTKIWVASGRGPSIRSYDRNSFARVDSFSTTNIVEDLCVLGDSLYGIRSFSTTYAPDSVLLFYNLVNNQQNTATVCQGATEIIPHKDSLYVLCPSFFSSLRLSRVSRNDLSVVTFEPGLKSGGAVAAIPTEDSIFIAVRSLSSSHYNDTALYIFRPSLGTASYSGYSLGGGSGMTIYSLARGGKYLWLGIGNYTDTSMVIQWDLSTQNRDTFLKLNTAAPRRMHYMKDDTSRSSSALTWAPPIPEVFPNPVRDVLHIQSSTPFRTVTYYTPMGAVVRRENLPYAVKGLSYRPELPAGVYFIQVGDGASLKLVVL